MSKKFIEILLVLIITFITPFIAIWKVALHPGYIYQRDSAPAFYLTSKQTAGSFLNFPSIMTNVYMPLAILSYFGILSPMLTDWIQYLLFPFAISIPSMYFASRYLLDEYEPNVKEWVKIFTSIVVSLLYSLTPTAYYFSHWSDYASFYALLPALIAGTLYSFKKGEVKGAILLALFASLSTTDPRGFVYTIFIVLTLLIYTHKLTDLKTLILAVPFYILLNLRLFLLLLANFHTYSSIGFSISSVQLWLNYLTFPLLDSMRGLGLFRPLVSFYAWNKAADYVISFVFIEVTLLGYIFIERKRRHIATYLLALYLFLVITISSSFEILGYTVNLNLIYPALNYLAQTPVYNYLWLFLPTYISEMVLAPLFLLSSFVIAKIISSKYFIPVLVLALISQSIFILPAIMSGNYLGQYNSQTPPQPLVSLGEFLNSKAKGNVMVMGVLPSPWLSFYSALPHEFTPPLSVNESNLGVLLNLFGVQYIVTTKNYLFSELLKNNDLKLVYNVSNFTVFENLNFTYYIKSPIYVDFQYPSYLPKDNINIIPPYLMFNVPPEYIGGFVGNASFAERLALEAYIHNITPVKLSVKHLPSCYNFTDTMKQILGYSVEIQSKYPGITYISVGQPSSLNFNVKPDKYDVVMIYVTVPNGGVFGITNGSYTIETSTSSANISLNFTYLGEISTYTGHLTLFYKGYTPGYLLGIILIPYNASLSSPHSAMDVISVPYSYTPTGRDIIISDVGNRASITLYAIIFNIISFFIVVAISLVIRINDRREKK